VVVTHRHLHGLRRCCGIAGVDGCNNNIANGDVSFVAAGLLPYVHFPGSLRQWQCQCQNGVCSYSKSTCSSCNAGFTLTTSKLCVPDKAPGYLRYEFHCSIASTVSWTANVYSQSAANDSLLIAVDAPNATRYPWHTGIRGGLESAALLFSESAASPTFTVTAGSHSMYVFQHKVDVAVASLTLKARHSVCEFSTSQQCGPDETCAGGNLCSGGACDLNEAPSSTPLHTGFPGSPHDHYELLVSPSVRWLGSGKPVTAANLPSTETECAAAAQASGLSLGGAGHAFAGNYSDVGCYTYTSGRYMGLAYWSTGHNANAATDSSSLRHTGSPCDNGACGTVADGALMAYYPFDGSLVDQSGNANDARVGVCLPADKLRCGAAVCEYAWTGISGTRVADLTSNSRYPDKPHAITALTSGGFEMRQRGDNLGAMLEGFMVAPTTGAYTFSTNSDDSSEVWAAPQPDSMADLKKVVELSGCCRKVMGSTKLSWIKGMAYYIKALVKEGGGGEYLYVGTMVGGKEYYPIPISMFKLIETCSANGVSADVGKFGNALRIDNQGSFVELPPAAWPSDHPSWTFAAWIQCSSCDMLWHEHNKEDDTRRNSLHVSMGSNLSTNFFDHIPNGGDPRTHHPPPPPPPIKWVLGKSGQSCTAVCAALPQHTCVESEFMNVGSTAAALAAAASAGIICTSYNQWDYSQGLSQCTNPSCCSGSCVGACSYPVRTTSATCSAVSTSYYQSRICPCKPPRQPARVRDGFNFNMSQSSSVPSDALADIASEWHHITWVREHTGQMKLYVDGVYAATEAVPEWYKGKDPTHGILGGYGIGSARQYFQGRIDDLHIFSTSLNGTAIAALASGQPRTYLPDDLSPAGRIHVLSDSAQSPGVTGCNLQLPSIPGTAVNTTFAQVCPVSCNASCDQPLGFALLWGSSNPGGGGLCEGDCDTDADCAGALKCFHRSSTDSAVPGCAESDISAANPTNWDYCYRPPPQRTIRSSATPWVTFQCNTIDTCLPCLPGMFDHDADAGTPCIACLEMTFSDTAGASECKPCPFGLVSPQGARACTANPLYMGCAADRVGHEADMIGKYVAMGPGTSDPLTTCQEFCKGFRFMGLQGDNLCFCDNSFGTHGMLTDTTCGVKGDACGRGGQTCRMANAVFKLAHWSCANIQCTAGQLPREAAQSVSLVRRVERSLLSEWQPQAGVSSGNKRPLYCGAMPQYKATQATIHVDGNSVDWGDVEVIGQPTFRTYGQGTESTFELKWADGVWRGVQDHSMAWAMSSDTDAVYLGIKVIDDVHHEPMHSRLWEGDSVHVLFTTNEASNDTWDMYSVALGQNERTEQSYAGGRRKPLQTHDVAINRTGTITTYEMRFPSSSVMPCVDLIVGQALIPTNDTVFPMASEYRCPTLVNSSNWLGTERHSDAFVVNQTEDGVTVKHLGLQDDTWNISLGFSCCKRLSNFGLGIAVVDSDDGQGMKGWSGWAPGKIAQWLAQKAGNDPRLIYHENGTGMGNNWSGSSRITYEGSIGALHGPWNGTEAGRVSTDIPTPSQAAYCTVSWQSWATKAPPVLDQSGSVPRLYVGCYASVSVRRSLLGGNLGGLPPLGGLLWGPDAGPGGPGGGVIRRVSHQTFSQCTALADSLDAPAFGLQDPQGSIIAGQAECVVLANELPTTTRAEDSVCEIEGLTQNGNRLGGDNMVAVYSRHRSVRVDSATVDGNQVWTSVVRPGNCTGGWKPVPSTQSSLSPIPSCFMDVSVTVPCSKQTAVTFQSGSGKTAAKWYDRSDSASVTWNDATAYCSQRNQELCPFAAYCPNGGGTLPIGGRKYGVAWSPVSDRPNQWVQVGSWGSSADNTCRGHHEVADGTLGDPAWGVTAGQHSGVGYLLCCSMGTGQASREPGFAGVELRDLPLEAANDRWAFGKVKVVEFPLCELQSENAVGDFVTYDIVSGYAHLKFHGSDWYLVRRKAAPPTWHPVDDNLQGTGSYGNRSTDPLGAHDFSVPWAQTAYTKVLVASGDLSMFIIMSRADITGDAFSAVGLHNYGVTGCTPSEPCERCAGDCDRDADCMPGLRCFQRDGYTKVTGCLSGGVHDTSDYDYCVPAVLRPCVNCSLDVIASSSGGRPAQQMMRPDFEGDPWISVDDHPRVIVYGESGSTQYATLGNSALQFGGSNVWVNSLSTYDMHTDADGFVKLTGVPTALPYADKVARALHDAEQRATDHATCCASSCASWSSANSCADGTQLVTDAGVKFPWESHSYACCTYPCPPGEFGEPNKGIACSACAMGRYSDIIGSAKCTVCPAGTFAPARQTGCVACAPGKYGGTGVVPTPCKSCAAGFYSSSSGSSSCTACQPGYDSIGGSSKCKSKIVSTAVTTTLAKDIATIPAGSAARAEFERQFIADIAARLGVSPDRININSIGGGSLVIDFTIAASPQGDPIATTQITQAFSAPGISIAGTTTTAPITADDARPKLRQPHIMEHCPTEAAACAASPVCADKMVAALASPSTLANVASAVNMELQRLLTCSSWALLSAHSNPTAPNMAGCTDPLAGNYDRFAISMDGSCSYDCNSLIMANGLVSATQCFVVGDGGSWHVGEARVAHTKATAWPMLEASTHSLLQGKLATTASAPRPNTACSAGCTSAVDLALNSPVQIQDSGRVITVNTSTVCIRHVKVSVVMDRQADELESVYLSSTMRAEILVSGRWKRCSILVPIRSSGTATFECAQFGSSVRVLATDAVLVSTLNLRMTKLQVFGSWIDSPPLQGSISQAAISNQSYGGWKDVVDTIGVDRMVNLCAQRDTQHKQICPFSSTCPINWLLCCMYSHTAVVNEMMDMLQHDTQRGVLPRSTHPLELTTVSTLPLLVNQTLTMRFMRVAGNTAYQTSGFWGSASLAAGVPCSSSTVSAQYIVLTQNEQRGFGASVLYSHRCKIAISYARVYGNQKIGHGSGVMWVTAGSDVVLSQTQFIANRQVSPSATRRRLVAAADNNTAAVVVEQASNVTMVDVTFGDNTGSNLIFVDRSQCTVDQSRFERHAGGDVLTATSSVVVVRHSIFQRNGGGNVLVASASSITVQNTIFEENSGGAAMIASESFLEVLHCKFLRNRLVTTGNDPAVWDHFLLSPQDAGAQIQLSTLHPTLRSVAPMSIWNGSTTVTASVFSANEGLISGAIFSTGVLVPLGIDLTPVAELVNVSDTTTDIHNVNFTDNHNSLAFAMYMWKSDTSSGPIVAAQAGAVYVGAGTVLNSTHCTFSGNFAGARTAAGAVFATATSCTLSNAIFTRNRAAADYPAQVRAGPWKWEARAAGSLLLDGRGTEVVLKKVDFVNNTARSLVGTVAGALQLGTGTVLSGRRCTMLDNTAVLSPIQGTKALTAAGAVFTATGVTLTLADVAFHRNRADGRSSRGSGAIYTGESKVDISYGSIINNTAELVGISATHSEALFIFSPKSIKISYSQFAPLLDGAQTVAINPGNIKGVTQGGCEQHPCLMGEACTHAKFSLSCKKCPHETVGTNGIECINCPRAYGPNDAQTGCNRCTGNDVSMYGTCRPCDKVSTDNIICAPCGSGLGPNINHTGCLPCTGNDRSSEGLCEECAKDLVVIHVPERGGNVDCGPCPVRQVPIEGPTPKDMRFCDCEEEYRNVRDKLHICFDGGYTEAHYENMIEVFNRDMGRGFHCQECAKDALLNPCLKCPAGGNATILAGFTVPVLPGEKTARRSLATANVQHTFRCHAQEYLAKIRCPANPDYDNQCAPGYTGMLCQSCEDEFGMTPGFMCEPCTKAGFTSKSAIILIAIISFVTIVVALAVKYWDRVPGKHFVRCCFVPMRILVTYAQIITQLGGVLSFPYPPEFQAVVDTIQPVIDFWGVLFRLMGVNSDCLGLTGFSSRWALRVFVLPAMLAFGVFVCWVAEKSLGKEKATSHAKGNAFLSVFFVYPTICAVAFQAFMCKALRPDVSILDADDLTLCSDPGHRALQAVSMIVVIVFSCGVPVALLILLVNKARSYSGRANDAQLIRKVAQNLEVKEEHARFVIRDLVIGADYSFAMDAYNPRYLYWESVDMLRKLSLVGLVLPVGRGSAAQINCALMLSFFFFALQCSVAPYKIAHDNTYRAATELHIFIVIIVAMTLRKVDLSREVLQFSFYNLFMFYTFMALVPLAFLVCVLAKLRFVKRVSQQHKNYGRNMLRQAFDRFYIGLAGGYDREILSKYLDTVRQELASDDFAKVIQGAEWRKTEQERKGNELFDIADKNQDGVLDRDEIQEILNKRGSTLDVDTLIEKADLDGNGEVDLSEFEKVYRNLVAESVLSATTSPEPESVSMPEMEPEPETELASASTTEIEQIVEDSSDAYYSKFDGGFEGTFADMKDFYGGLEKLIGDCRKDVYQAMMEEHCEVKDGYAQSDGEFQTSSYKVVSTPRKEWLFVTEPEAVGAMPAGIDRRSGNSRGSRTKASVEKLLKNAGQLITRSFIERGLNVIVTEDDVKALPLLLEEVIAMRLYTVSMLASCCFIARM
jgi:Ca2+-binding EF-hand superfamily protein